MNTPYGAFCRHYYQDFHRNHNTQECRLLKGNQTTLPWKPEDCKNCPVPGIIAANASPDLILDLIIKPVFLGLGRRKSLTAHCAKHDCLIDDPHLGCTQCAAERSGLDAFKRALEESDD